MIHQFYATLEVQAENERLIWMTGTHKFEATYKDLATAMKVDYRKMKKGKSISDLPMLLAGEQPKLYY